MTTRSGSNKTSGVLYEYFRNDKLDARNFFATQRPPFRWNVFGGAVGGPVIRNKTFYFAHVEFQRQRVGQVRTFTVPTDPQRRGDFSRTTTAGGAVTPIYDPFSSRPNPANPAQTIRDQFPGNVIPQSRIDAAGARIAAPVSAVKPPGRKPGWGEQLHCERRHGTQHYDGNRQGGPLFQRARPVLVSGDCA